VGARREQAGVVGARREQAEVVVGAVALREQAPEEEY